MVIGTDVRGTRPLFHQGNGLSYLTSSAGGQLGHRRCLARGQNVKEVRFADPVIPPELLLARRTQLAEQLRNTYSEEKRAQDERIKTEKARATADNYRQDDPVRRSLRAPRPAIPSHATGTKPHGRTFQKKSTRGLRVPLDPRKG